MESFEEILDKAKRACKVEQKRLQDTIKHLQEDLAKKDRYIKKLQKKFQTIEPPSIGDILLLCDLDISDEAQLVEVVYVNVESEIVGASWLIKTQYLDDDELIMVPGGKSLKDLPTSSFILSTGLEENACDPVTFDQIYKNLTKDPDPRIHLILDKRVVRGFGTIASRPGEWSFSEIEQIQIWNDNLPDKLRQFMIRDNQLGWCRRTAQSLELLKGGSGSSHHPALKAFIQECPEPIHKDIQDPHEGICVWCNLPRKITTLFEGNVGMGSFCYTRYEMFVRVCHLIDEIDQEVLSTMYKCDGNTESLDEDKIDRKVNTLCKEAEYVASVSYEKWLTSRKRKRVTITGIDFRIAA